MRPSTPLRSALLLLAACSTAPGRGVPAPAPSPAEVARAALALEVRAVSAKAEALLRAQDELVWKSWTEGTPADLAKTYAGSDAWLTPAAISSVERLREMRASRSQTMVNDTLSALERAARGSENLMPRILEACGAQATVGEISDRLRGVFGEYRENS